MPAQKINLTGTVERQVVYKGSKSEREAVVLQQDGFSGPPLIMRIMGGNPFYDTDLEQFVGKRVSFEAFVHGANAIVEKLSDILVIAPPKKYPKNNGLKL